MRWKRVKLAYVANVCHWNGQFYTSTWLRAFPGKAVSHIGPLWPKSSDPSIYTHIYIYIYMYALYDPVRTKTSFISKILDHTNASTQAVAQRDGWRAADQRLHSELYQDQACLFVNLSKARDLVRNSVWPVIFRQAVQSRIMGEIQAGAYGVKVCDGLSTCWQRGRPGCGWKVCVVVVL